MKKTIYLLCLACELYVCGSLYACGEAKRARLDTEQLSLEQQAALSRVIENQIQDSQVSLENVLKEHDLTVEGYLAFFQGTASQDGIEKARLILQADDLTDPVRKLIDNQLTPDELNVLGKIVFTEGDLITSEEYNKLLDGNATESEVAKARGLIEAFNLAESKLPEVTLSESQSDGEPTDLMEVTKFFHLDVKRDTNAVDTDTNITRFEKFLTKYHPEQQSLIQKIKNVGTGKTEALEKEDAVAIADIIKSENYQQFNDEQQKIAELNGFFTTDGKTFLRFLIEKRGMLASEKQLKDEFSNISAMSDERKLFLASMLDRAEYQQFKRCCLPVTGLSYNLTVKVLDTIGDGDCAFRAMAPEDKWQGETGTTRKWAADLLLAHIDDPEMRKHIGAEIKYRMDHNKLPRKVVDLTKKDKENDNIEVVSAYIESFVRPATEAYAAHELNFREEANFLEMPSPAMNTSVATALAYIMNVNLIVINAEDGTVLYGAEQRNPDLPDLIVAQDGPNHVCRTEVIKSSTIEK